MSAAEAAGALLARRLREQAAQCAELGSPLSSALLTAAAADLLAGGPTALVLAGREREPAGSALALRLLAALHRQVLTRQAPELAVHYPSVGGTAAAELAWPAARAVLAARTEQVRADVELPCQTNEPGRMAALLVGLLAAVQARPGPVRLLEIGASAGLNLHVDRFRIGSFGPAAGPVLLTSPWAGRAPGRVALELVERAGCDPAPIDPGSAAGRLALSASVWADQVERFARLRTALAVAAADPVVVDRSPASGWLPDRLAHPAAGTTTVVWQSVVWQYMGTAETGRVQAVLAAAGARATAQAPLVHLRLEPERRGDRVVFALRSRRWPGGHEEHLADAQGHGPPVRLLP